MRIGTGQAGIMEQERKDIDLWMNLLSFSVCW